VAVIPGPASQPATRVSAFGPTAIASSTMPISEIARAPSAITWTARCTSARVNVPFTIPEAIRNPVTT